MRRNEIPERIDREQGADTRAELHIPFLAGRPDRENMIATDDLTNLVIALYTAKSLEDFLDVT